MLEGSDWLIEQKGYLFSSIFVFRGRGRGAAHIVRTLLGGGYLNSVQKRTRGEWVQNYRISSVRAF